MSNISITANSNSPTDPGSVLVQKVQVVTAGSGFEPFLQFENLKVYSDSLYSINNPAILNISHLVNQGKLSFN